MTTVTFITTGDGSFVVKLLLTGFPPNRMVTVQFNAPGHFSGSGTVTTDANGSASDQPIDTNCGSVSSIVIWTTASSGMIYTYGTYTAPTC